MISVIIPLYNKEAIIERALQSVQRDWRNCIDIPRRKNNISHAEVRRG